MNLKQVKYLCDLDGLDSCVNMYSFFFLID